MAMKSVIFIALALCLLSFSDAHGHHHHSEEDAAVKEEKTAANVQNFIVQGKVYCDTCNVQFMTKISEPIAGATVRLVCTDLENASNVTLKEEATTNEHGEYSFKVDGDHADEECRVEPVKSSRDDCAEWNEKDHKQQSAVISITGQNGIIQSQVRTAGSLGFMKKDPLPDCDGVLKDLGLNPDGTEIDSN